MKAESFITNPCYWNQVDAIEGNCTTYKLISVLHWYFIPAQ